MPINIQPLPAVMGAGPSVLSPGAGMPSKDAIQNFEAVMREIRGGGVFLEGEAPVVPEASYLSGLSTGGALDPTATLAMQRDIAEREMAIVGESKIAGAVASAIKQLSSLS